MWHPLSWFLLSSVIVSAALHPYHRHVFPVFGVSRSLYYRAPISSTETVPVLPHLLKCTTVSNFLKFLVWGCYQQYPQSSTLFCITPSLVFLLFLKPEFLKKVYRAPSVYLLLGVTDACNSHHSSALG